MEHNKTHILKILTLSVVLLIIALSAWSVKRAMMIPMTYSTEQFLPKGHPLIENDRLNRKVFGISIYSPQILVITQRRATQSFIKGNNLRKLQQLTKEIEGYAEVEQVISLGNVETAIAKDKELMFGTIADLKVQGLSREKILSNPMFVPSLLSKDARSSAVIVMPRESELNLQMKLSDKMTAAAKKYYPDAQVRIGGPAPIRSELLKLLSKEIVIFLALSLVASLIVLKLMFHGWSMVWQTILMLIASNLIALGTVSYLKFSYNMLSSTLSILVTVCCLGIISRTLVRMGRLSHRTDRRAALLELIRELWIPHVLAAFSTAVGFATLAPSNVPLISQYGLGVAVGVVVGGFVTLALMPCFYLWMPWPQPRAWLGSRNAFAAWIVRNTWSINAGMALTLIIFFAIGVNLSWTSRLYDDLPKRNEARATTDFIGNHLGGSVSFDVRVDLKKERAPWKNPKNLAKLDKLAKKWRKNSEVGSLLTLSDFMMAGQAEMPKNPKAVAEIQFLFGMSPKNPLPHFLSSDEKSTRLAFRFPDLPADHLEPLTAGIIADLKRAFPGSQVHEGDLAAVVPKVNEELSKRLMLGFFDAMFFVVLMLAFVFRSLRWALVAAIPNFVPPILLLGFLALFNIPIKPGIAIIFSISLGLAFDNTVYILERLKELMKKHKSSTRLPIARVVAEETNPLLVSSLCLLAGFTIFLFSYFPVNQMFGVFMLISIAAGLLGDLVWLPALLHRFPGLLLPYSKDATLLERPRWMESAMKLSPYAIFLVLGLVTALAARAEKPKKPVRKPAQTKEAPPTPTLTPEKVLSEMEARTSPPQESVELKMTIHDADGSKKERWISILRKSGKEQKALVRLEKPSDLKGLALLSVNSKNKEDQWLYLPSTKKTRKILGSNQKGKFLDSEIAYEDLRPSSYKTFTNKVTKQSSDMIEVESVAKRGSASSYSKVHASIRLPDYQLVKMEYWDEKGKLLKRAEFKDYQKVGEKFWRAKSVEVVNLQNKRKTTLELMKISLKKISDDDLSVAALEE